MRICEIAQVTRGYNCPKDNLTTDSNKGKEIYPLNFSDISSNEINVPEKKFFINSSTALKYLISVYDIVLPATYTANILAKCIFSIVKRKYDNNEQLDKPFIYSQNVVLIRLYKPEKDYIYYMPNELTTLLNTEKMQQKLKSNVYTKTKGILIANLCQLELPYPTPELKQKLKEVEEKTNELEKCKKELEEKMQELNNLI